jgi:hypothetical protein
MASPPVRPIREILRIAAPGHFAAPIESGTISSDGSIYVADPGNHRIAVFDSAGALVRFIGRAGSGPGEFQGAVLHVAIGGDTVFVIARDLHAFSTVGTHLFDSRLDPENVQAPAGRRVFALGHTDAGLVVARSGNHDGPTASSVPARSEVMPGSAEIRIDSVQLQIFDTRTMQLQSPSLVLGMLTSFRIGPQFASALFASLPSFAIGRSGYFFTKGSEYQIEIYSVHGEVEGLLLGDIAPEPVRPSERRVARRLVVSYAEQMEKQDPHWRGFTDAARKTPVSPTKPLLGRLVAAVDNAHLILVERARNSPVGQGRLRGPSRWDLLDTERGTVAQLELPDNLKPLALRANRILAASTGSTDSEPTIYVFRIEMADVAGGG